jgi:hypothetical protein
MRFQVLALVLVVSGSFAAAQETVDVPVDRAGAVAAQALVAGQTELALQIAEAVLAQRPDDRDALVLVAAAAPRVGDPTKGRLAGVRAWAVSGTDAQKYEAARLTALAAANEERFTLSTFWLRRALTVAPNDTERDQTLRDARVVSQRNPWSTQLSFSLSPSSNLNGGAETDTLVVDGVETGGQFSEDSQALAGWRATLGFGTTYRLHQNAKSRTTVGLQHQSSRVKVTDDTNIPDDSFDSTATTLSLRYDRALEVGTITAHGSRSKYDYRDYSTFTDTSVGEFYRINRAGLSGQFPVNDRASLSLSFDREWITYSIASIGDVERNIISAGASYRLGNGDQLRTTFSRTESTGETANYTSSQKGLGFSYGWADPIGPISLSAGANLSWIDYPDFRLAFANIQDGRQDRSVSLFANVGFPQASYAGFTPGLRIDASRTNSNVSRYDRKTLSAGLTITSQF